MPTVSVIIPTYNRASLVVKAVDSVLAQTYKDYELIVVDDGSTDNTEQCLKRYGNDIKYIYQHNGGVNKARNTGIDAASGQYIALLDNDDLWREDKLARQVVLLENNPKAAYIFSDFSILKANGSIMSGGLMSWNPYQPDWLEKYCRKQGGGDESHCLNEEVYQCDIYKVMLDQPLVLPTTAVFDRKYFDAGTRFPEDDSICGDWEYFSRLSKESKVLFMPSETAINRSHEDEVRLTRTARKTQLEFRLKMISRLWMQDSEFLAENMNLINVVRGRYLAELVKISLFEGDRSLAIKRLDEVVELETLSQFRISLLRVLGHLPCSHLLLRGVREVLHAIK